MHFRCLFAKIAKKHQETTGFIRYFDQLFRQVEKAVLPMLFYVLQGRETTSFYSEKRNAFLINFGPICENGPKNDQETSGPIAFSDMEIPSFTFSEKPNGFL